jgi:hypothetical protein
MFDKLLENLDDVAEKLGLPADQVKTIAESLTGKMGAGGDKMAALLETAQEHGLPVEKLQSMLGSAGIDAEGLLEKAGGLLGAGGEGSQSALGGLMGTVKGLFGKS